jgi:hypothetical protein
MTKFVVSLTENDPTKITNFTREQKSMEMLKDDYSRLIDNAGARSFRQPTKLC